MASIATLQARLTKRQEQLAIAETTYENLLAKSNKSYTFGSGGGGEQQSATKQSLAELKKQIDLLVAEIDKIEAQIAGTGGVVRLGMGW
jgi:hypothetical protein